MTEKKTAQNPSTVRRGGKLMLSGALILVSGAYAWSQHAAPPIAQSTAQPDQPPEQVAALSQAALPSSAPPSPQDNTAAPAAPVPRSAESRVQSPETQTAQPDAPAVANALPPDEAPVSAAAAAPTEPEAPVTLASNAPPPAAQTSGRYTNGDFTGRPADTAWGLVQVRVSVRGGAITVVDPIDYPQHRRRSVQINNYALPVLEREVIQAQSASVDIVSQATTTSVGYLQSLATALSQAKK